MTEFDYSDHFLANSENIVKLGYNEQLGTSQIRLL